MLRRALLPWLAATATAWPLWASASEVILVADGSQNSPVIQQLREEAVAGVRPAPGYPRVMSSDDIAGLKPGRLVTVIGFCDTRKAAQKVVSALRGKLPLSSRAVEGEWPDACPGVDPPPPKDPYEAELRARLERDPSSRSALLEYAKFLQMAGRLEEAQVQLAKLLKLDPDNDEAKTLQSVIRVLQQGGP